MFMIKLPQTAVMNRGEQQPEHESQQNLGGPRIDVSHGDDILYVSTFGGASSSVWPWAAIMENLHPMLTRDPAVPLSENTHLLRWVEKVARLTKPSSIHWVDGSQQENDLLCKQMCQSGTLIKLNPELWPGCYYARSNVNDVARVEDRTFICSLSKDAAGPTNNWMDPYEMRRKLKVLFNGSMHGRTMYVLAFSMGPI